MREWRIAALVFAAAALLLTLPGFLPGRGMCPIDLPRDSGAWKPDPNVRVIVSNKLLSDAALEFRVWDHEVRRQLASGQFPWRNVWAGDGAHLFANPEASLLFPLTWVRIAMGDRGWVVVCFLKLFLAGLGMWWLARVATGCDWRSALVAGVAFMTSGYMTVWLLSPHTNVYAMLPWLAAAALSRRYGLTIVFAALATAGGHPETLFYGVTGIAIFLFVRRERAWVVPALVGFLIVAVQLVPFAVAASKSDLLARRLGGGRGFTRVFAIPATLLPGYLGSPLAGEIDLSGIAQPAAENFNERAGGYAGLVALLVVLLAWRRVPRAALGIAVVALVLSWHLPGLRVIDRLPGATERLGLVFAFFISMCVGVCTAGVSPADRRASRPPHGPAARTPPDQPAGTPAVHITIFLIAVGIVVVLIGVFLALPVAQPILTRFARAGIAMLQHRGYLRLPSSIYEARLAGYLAGFATVALRRIAVPGLCLTMFALRRNSRALIAAAIAIEGFAFAFGYNPAVPLDRAAVTPPAIAAIPHDPRFFIAAAPDVYPPNLATLDHLRDIRSYDVLQPRERIAALQRFGYDPEARGFPAPPPPQLGVRWFVTRQGVVEIPNAVPQPWPVNAPPPGFGAGLAISIVALAAALLSSSINWNHHDSNTSG